MQAFSLLYRVFYDRMLGPGYVRNGKGFGLKPLVVLSVFIAFLVALKVFFLFSMITPETIARISSQMPEIVVQNGVITSPKDYMYTYVSPEEDVFFVFDTANALPNLNGLPSKGVYITSRSLYSINEKDTRLVPLDRLFRGGNFILNQENMQKTLESLFVYFRNFSPIVVFFLFIPGVFFMYLLVLCFYTAVSFLMTLLAKTDMPFENRLRLAALSLMPVSILNALASVAGLHIRLGYSGILITLIYMYCFFRESEAFQPSAA